MFWVYFGLKVVCRFSCQFMIGRCVCRNKRRNFDDRQKRPNTPYEGKGARHGSADGTRVSHCNSLRRLSFGSKQLAPCVCVLGWMCHQASTHSHRDAHRMVASTELGSCTCVCTHQTEGRRARVRPVRHGHFLGVVESVVETKRCVSVFSIKKCVVSFMAVYDQSLRVSKQATQLSRSTHEGAVVLMHGLESAIHWIVQASRKNYQFAKYHQRPKRTLEWNDVHAGAPPQMRNTCSGVPRTNCETCAGELEPRSGCSCAPRSSAPRSRRNYSAL